MAVGHGCGAVASGNPNLSSAMMGLVNRMPIERSVRICHRRGTFDEFAKDLHSSLPIFACHGRPRRGPASRTGDAATPTSAMNQSLTAEVAIGYRGRASAGLLHGSGLPSWPIWQQKTRGKWQPPARSETGRRGKAKNNRAPKAW